MTNIKAHTAVATQHMPYGLSDMDHQIRENWNTLVAATETMNKLSLRMKTALFTDLRYFLPLVEGSIHAGAVQS